MLQRCFEGQTAPAACKPHLGLLVLVHFLAFTPNHCQLHTYRHILPSLALMKAKEVKQTAEKVAAHSFAI